MRALVMLAWLLAFVSHCTTATEYLVEQRRILREIYTASGGEQWLNANATAEWGTGNSNSFCLWKGVVCCMLDIMAPTNLSYSLPGIKTSQACTTEGDILALVLDGFGLHGTLPPSIADLTSLQVLQLADNPDLRGSLPPALLSRRSLLEVDVRGSSMSCSVAPGQVACDLPSGFAPSREYVSYTSADTPLSYEVLQPPGATVVCSSFLHRDGPNASTSVTSSASARIAALVALPPPGSTVLLSAPSYWQYQSCVCLQLSGSGTVAARPPKLSRALDGGVQALCTAAEPVAAAAGDADGEEEAVVPVRVLVGVLIPVCIIAVGAVAWLVLLLCYLRRVSRGGSDASKLRWTSCALLALPGLQRVDIAAGPSFACLRSAPSESSPAAVQEAASPPRGSNAMAAKRAKPPGSYPGLFGDGVTLVATDVEGSTELWEWQPDVMNVALGLHDRIIRLTISHCCGYEITTEGDAFLVAFHEPGDAVRWALLLQSALLKLDWPPLLLEHPLCRPRPLVPVADVRGVGEPPKSTPLLVLFKGLSVRMGIATGVPSSVREHPVTRRMQYTGAVLRLATGIAELGSGGQVLLEPMTFKGIHHKFEELDVVESEVQELADTINSKAQMALNSQLGTPNFEIPWTDGPQSFQPSNTDTSGYGRTAAPRHISQDTRHPPPFKTLSRLSLGPSVASEASLGRQTFRRNSLVRPGGPGGALRPRTTLTQQPLPPPIGTSSRAQVAGFPGTCENSLRSVHGMHGRGARPASYMPGPLSEAPPSISHQGSSMVFTSFGSPGALSGAALMAANQQLALQQSMSSMQGYNSQLPPMGALSSARGSSEWMAVHQTLLGYASNPGTATILQSLYGSNTSRQSRLLSPIDVAAILGSRASVESSAAPPPGLPGGSQVLWPPTTHRSNLQGLFMRTLTAEITGSGSQGHGVDRRAHGSITAAEPGGEALMRASTVPAANPHTQPTQASAGQLVSEGAGAGTVDVPSEVSGNPLYPRMPYVAYASVADQASLDMFCPAVTLQGSLLGARTSGNPFGSGVGLGSRVADAPRTLDTSGGTTLGSYFLMSRRGQAPAPGPGAGPSMLPGPVAEATDDKTAKADDPRSLGGAAPPVGGVSSGGVGSGGVSSGGVGSGGVSSGGVSSGGVGSGGVGSGGVGSGGVGSGGVGSGGVGSGGVGSGGVGSGGVGMGEVGLSTFSAGSSGSARQLLPNAAGAQRQQRQQGPRPESRNADDDEAFLELLMNTAGSSGLRPLLSIGCFSDGIDTRNSSTTPQTPSTSAAVSAPRVPAPSPGGQGPGARWRAGVAFEGTAAAEGDVAATSRCKTSEAHCGTAAQEPSDEDTEVTSGPAMGAVGDPEGGPSRVLSQHHLLMTGANNSSAVHGSHHFDSSSTASRGSTGAGVMESFSFTPVFKHLGPKRHARTAEVERCVYDAWDLADLAGPTGGGAPPGGGPHADGGGGGNGGDGEKSVPQPIRPRSIRKSVSFIARQTEARSAPATDGAAIGSASWEAWLQLGIAGGGKPSSSLPHPAASPALPRPTSDSRRFVPEGPGNEAEAPSCRSSQRRPISSLHGRHNLAAVAAAVAASRVAGTAAAAGASARASRDGAGLPAAPQTGPVAGVGAGVAGPHGATHLRRDATLRATLGGQTIHRLASRSTALGSASPVHAVPHADAPGISGGGAGSGAGASGGGKAGGAGGGAQGANPAGGADGPCGHEGFLATSASWQPQESVSLALSAGAGLPGRLSATQVGAHFLVGSVKGRGSVAGSDAGGGGGSTADSVNPVDAWHTAGGSTIGSGGAPAGGVAGAVQFGGMTTSGIAPMLGAAGLSNGGNGADDRSGFGAVTGPWARVAPAGALGARPRHPTFGALDLPELDALNAQLESRSRGGQVPGRFSLFGANEANAATGSKGTMHGLIVAGANAGSTPGGFSASVGAALAPNAATGEGVVLALRSAMVHEAMGSSANRTAKKARDLAIQEAAEPSDAEDSLPCSPSAPEPLRHTDGAAAPPIKPAGAQAHSESASHGPQGAQPSTTGRLSALLGSQLLEDSERRTYGGPSRAASFKSAKRIPSSGENRGRTLMRLVRRLPSYGMALDMEQTTSNPPLKGGRKGDGVSQGAGPPAAESFEVMADSEIERRPRTVGGTHGAEGEVYRMVSSRRLFEIGGSSKRVRSLLKLHHRSPSAPMEPRGSVAADGPASTVKSGVGAGFSGDSSHALVVIDMGVHRLQLPALGAAYGDVYDGVQVIQILPAHLKHRGAYHPPLKSQAQLAPGFFDAPGAAQALMPCVPCQQPSFPRLSLMFVQPASYSAIANTNPEVAERSGAVFCSAVREVLRVFGAYECQEYECTFMVACHGPRVAAELGLALHEWLMQADWPADLLELSSARLVLARNGRPLLRGFRAKVGIFTGVPLSVVPHATTGRADYFGAIVNRAARLMAGAKAGQILLDKTAGLEVLREWRQAIADANAAFNMITGGVTNYMASSLPSEEAPPVLTSMPSHVAAGMARLHHSAQMPPVGAVPGIPVDGPQPASTGPSNQKIPTASLRTSALAPACLPCSLPPDATAHSQPGADTQQQQQQLAEAAYRLPSPPPMATSPQPPAVRSGAAGAGAPPGGTLTADDDLGGQQFVTRSSAFALASSSAAAGLTYEHYLAAMAASALAASVKAFVVPVTVQVVDLGTYKLKGLPEGQAVVSIQLKIMSAQTLDAAVGGGNRGVDACDVVAAEATGLNNKAALVQPGRGLIDELLVAVPVPLSSG